MKHVYPFSLMILSCVLLAISLGSAALAEPLAPISKFSEEGIKLVKMQDKSIKDFEKDIPSKKEVGIPVYPGATVSSVFGGPGQEDWPLTVNLISNDPPETIKEWYRNKLEGWGYSDKLKLFHEGRQEPTFPELSEGKYRTVGIMEEDGRGIDLWLLDVPDVKTRIQIIYKSRGK